MRLSLRLRLLLAASVLAFLTVTAAGIAVYGLARSSYHANEAMAAQRRLETYGLYAARVNDWTLSWLFTLAPQATARPNPASVYAMLDALDQLVSQDVTHASSVMDEAQRARQSMAPARLRGLFQQLDAALQVTPPGTPGGDAAMAFYTAQAPQVLSQQSEQEARRRDQALAAMKLLTQRLNGLAIFIGIAAPVLLIWLYLFGFRPFFTRLSRASLGAEALSSPDAGVVQGGHDELGLMLARLRQMSRRIERRRQKLAQDYAQLEQLVQGRTAELSTANTKLAHIDASRRRFFADVGHELRTPLTVIMGEAELLSLHQDPTITAASAKILTRAKRLMARIEDLLRIARSDTGQLELQHGPFSLRKIVAAAAADMAPSMRRAGQIFESDLPDLTLAGDADWIRQVIAGILENAAKYAGRGARVQISAARRAGRAIIRISDNGPGLTDVATGAESTRIFDRFARGSNPQASLIGGAQSFGVGLALAHWVVEASSGQLRVLECETPGLCLEIDLPLWEEG